jgi:hypothetical protein
MTVPGSFTAPEESRLLHDVLAHPSRLFRQTLLVLTGEGAADTLSSVLGELPDDVRILAAAAKLELHAASVPPSR